MIKTNQTILTIVTSKRLPAGRQGLNRPNEHNELNDFRGD
jgi:hypothetical protein